MLTTVLWQYKRLHVTFFELYVKSELKRHKDGDRWQTVLSAILHDLQ
jgi:hypothetical protein